MMRIFILIMLSFVVNSGCATQAGQTKSCACAKESCDMKVKTKKSSENLKIKNLEIQAEPMQEVSQEEVVKQVKADLKKQKSALKTSAVKIPAGMNFVYNQVIVKLQREVDLQNPKIRLQIQKAAGAKIKSIKAGALNTALITFEETKPARRRAEQKNIVDKLSNLDMFQYVEANQIMHAM